MDYIKETYEALEALNHMLEDVDIEEDLRATKAKLESIETLAQRGIECGDKDTYLIACQSIANTAWADHDDNIKLVAALLQDAKEAFRCLEAYISRKHSKEDLRDMFREEDDHDAAASEKPKPPYKQMNA